MNKALPWNVNGVGFDAREAAREAARRQGKSLGEWLHGVIADHAADLGVDAHDVAAQQRIDAVTSKLERLSARSADHERRVGRHHEFARRSERDDEPGRERRRPRGISADETEYLLEEAIDAMERRARRTEQHTTDALNSLARLLERKDADRERERDAVSDLARKLTDIETRLSDSDGRPATDTPIKGALARLEARLETIGKRSAAESSTRRTALAAGRNEDLGQFGDKLDAILEAVKQSASSAAPMSLAAARGAPQDRRLDDAIAEISRRQKSLDRGETPISLHDAIARRKGAPARLAETGAASAPFAAMERDIATLATRIDDLRRDVIGQREATRSPTDSIEALRADIAAMTSTLRDLAPRADASALEGSIRALDDRIDRSRANGVREATLRPVEVVVDGIRRSAESAEPRRAIEGLEGDLRAIDGKLGGLAAAEPAAIAQIHAQMREIKDLVATTAAQPLAIERLERQMESLGRRIERQTRIDGSLEVATTSDAIGAIASQTTDTAAFAKIEDRLEALGAKIDRAVDQAAAPAPRPSDESLEGLVRDLSRRLDAVQTPGAGSEAFDALQRQIALLSARFEKSSDGLGKLASLERSMQDLFGHLEQTRGEFEASAARAASEALRHVMDDDALHSGDEAGLAAMKALQEQAEARTSSTLSAVHETLERVVDRLSAMESDIEQVRSAGQTPTRDAAAPATPPKLSVVPQSAKARPTPKDIRLGAPDPMFDHALGRLGETRTEKSGASSDDQNRADFIAAARRAAKAAQSDPSIADLKRVAASGSEADSPVRAGLIEQSRDYVARHKRPVLLGIAALFVIIGTMAIVQRIGLGGDESRMADAAAPAPIERTVENTDRSAARAPTSGADDALTPSALPKSRPPIATQIPGSDPAQAATVSSLPAFAAQGITQSRPGLPEGLSARAQAGDGAAEYLLGSQYAEGRLVPRDFKLAAKWYQKAADQGLAPAKYRLASLYEKGLGLERDKSKAKALYLEAAEAGNPRAMHNLAVLLADGNGKPDYDSAATWFRKAAQYGVHDSQYNLAILLARGLGVQQSLLQSYQWFAIAAAQNDADAAKKRDEVATKLSANDLAVAKALAASFHPRVADVAATEVSPPPGGWDGVGAASPLNSARPKISSL